MYCRFDFQTYQGKSVISQLLKQVMQRCGLKQKDLAEVLEVSLSRVKAMTSGRVKNFTREEIELLVEKLDIRADWLITGEGSMLIDDESQDEVARRMQAIHHMRAVVEAMPLPELARKQLAAVMSGDAAEDGAMIGHFLQSGITETAVNKAVIDAVDLLSLEDRIDAKQLAKAVVKLVARQPLTPAAAESAGSVVLNNVTGSQTIAGRDMTVTRGKSK